MKKIDLYFISQVVALCLIILLSLYGFARAEELAKSFTEEHRTLLLVGIINGLVGFIFISGQKNTKDEIQALKDLLEREIQNLKEKVNSYENRFKDIDARTEKMIDIRAVNLNSKIEFVRDTFEGQCKEIKGDVGRLNETSLTLEEHDRICKKANDK